jgi:hypothetical protein
VYRTWLNPLAIEAVIEPCWPVLRSVMSTRNPAGVSCMWTWIRSPGFMSRSLCTSGFTALRSGLSKVPVNSGLAGAWETPFLVT